MKGGPKDRRRCDSYLRAAAGSGQSYSRSSRRRDTFNCLHNRGYSPVGHGQSKEPASQARQVETNWSELPWNYQARRMQDWYNAGSHSRKGKNRHRFPIGNSDLRSGSPDDTSRFGSVAVCGHRRRPIQWNQFHRLSRNLSE